MSSALKLDPRWPEPACFTATSAFSLHMSARSPRVASRSAPAARTRSKSLVGISFSSGTSVARR